MVAQLAELAQSPDDLVTKGHLPSPIEQNSIIQHLGWDFVKKKSLNSLRFSLMRENENKKVQLLNDKIDQKTNFSKLPSSKWLLF